MIFFGDYCIVTRFQSGAPCPLGIGLVQRLGAFYCCRLSFDCVVLAGDERLNPERRLWNPISVRPVGKVVEDCPKFYRMKQYLSVLFEHEKELSHWFGYALLYPPMTNGVVNELVEGSVWEFWRLTPFCFNFWTLDCISAMCSLFVMIWFIMRFI